MEDTGTICLTRPTTPLVASSPRTRICMYICCSQLFGRKSSEMYAQGIIRVSGYYKQGSSRVLPSASTTRL
jgi:hypothetical protein